MTIQEFVKEGMKLEEAIELPFSTREKFAPRNTILTDYHQLEDSVYFIRSGIMITSLLYKEEERILDFHFPNSFVGSYSSLLTKSPSDVRLKCYKDCDLEIINYAELLSTYKTSLLANQIGRMATEQLFLSRVTREKELLTMNAEERYQSLLKKNPDLVKTIPVKELSKYLGIRPESLSRIRKG